MSYRSDDRFQREQVLGWALPHRNCPDQVDFAIIRCEMAVVR